jgi:polar amino acid transport system substrate-binding protein
MQKSTLFAAALAALTTTVSAETVKLTTLEWPPYVNADGTGASTDAVTSAFAAAGDDVVAEVFPWNRAVNLAAKNPDYLGLYPEYYDAGADAEKGGDRCVYSAPFGTSPVGFIHRKDNAFDWSDHASLGNYRIGVVEGYINEARFDAMVADGSLKVDAGPTDASNVEKVAAGRMDAAVIDRNVFEHMLATEPRLAKHADTLVFHETPLANHNLLVCFENSDAGRAARDRFNSGL